MIAFENLASVIEHPRLKQWLASSQLQQSHSQQLETHGKWKNWCAALSQLSTLNHHSFKLNADNAIVKVGNTDSLTGQQQNILRETLKQFHPWRKGPFEICGVLIDSEWRSNLKWDRLINSIQPLKNRVILDVGCGNGYFGWRMLAQGAQLIVGIDPFPLYVAQFHAISQFSGLHPHTIMAIRMEDLPYRTEAFDTVFSMGVLYHRKSAFDHLIELRDSLRPGGELVLETIVIDGPLGMTLLPEKRYASMHNVWLLPSCLTLESWLKRSGFCNIQLIDITQTTSYEQRTTESMTFKSFADFLDPKNPNLTIEGYPAPQRAIYIAEKKT